MKLHQIKDILEHQKENTTCEDIRNEINQLLVPVTCYMEIGEDMDEVSMLEIVERTQAVVSGVVHGKRVDR